MHYKYKEDKNLTSLDSQTPSENPIFHPKPPNFKSELKKAEKTIETLLQEKESLKSALSSAVRKKEELYKVLLEYKDALERASKRMQQLEENFLNIQSVKTEIETVKRQLIKRDQKIKSLHGRNKTLEHLLEQHTENLFHTNLKKESGLMHSRNKLDNALESLIKKVKVNGLYQTIFNACGQRASVFVEYFDRNFEEGCVQLCKFVCELMKELEKQSMRPLSPCDPHSNSSLGSTGNVVSFAGSNEDEHFLYNDEERFEKLNSELQIAVARSKEILSNRSFSQGLKKPLRIETSFSPIPSFHSEFGFSTKNADDNKHTLQEIPEVRPKTTKSTTRRTPKVEIVNKTGNKSVKSLPKASILKKS